MKDQDCIQIEKKAREHLMRCALDDFQLGLGEMGEAFSRLQTPLLNFMKCVGELKNVPE